MKEKILNFLKSKLFFAFVINAVIMFFCIAVTSFSYDNSGDFYNSLYICQYHFYYSDTINYILSTLIGSIQFAMTGFNCYVLSQVLLSFLSFTTITYVFTDKFGKRKAFIFTLLLNILFSLNHYADIHSAKTSAILLAAGFLLVLNAVRNKRYNLPCWIGVVEIAFGSFYCYYYFFIALAFSVMYFFADMISKRKYKIAFRKFFWYFRPFLLMFALVFFVVIGLNQYSYSVNHSSQEASDFYKYSQLTNSINQLPFPDYSEHKEEFEQVGITSDNDYELLKSGYYDSENALNINTLSLVSDIQHRENNKNVFYEIGNIFLDMFNHIIRFDCYAIIIFLFLIFAVLHIVLHKKRFAFFPVLFVVCSIISSALIRYFFGGHTYIVYGIWLLLFVFLIYSFNFEQFKPKKTDSQFKIKNSAMFVSVISVICLLICYSAVFQSNHTGIRMKDRPSSLYSEINRHPECYYVLDPTTAVDYIKYTDNYIHPLWGFKRNYLNNIDSFGYFNRVEQLRKRNLSENIYKAVLSDNKIYVVDKYITFKKERYFTEHYSTNNSVITYNQIKEFNKFKIYKVTSE